MPPVTFGGRTERSLDIQVFSVYSILTTDWDGYVTASYLETYGEDAIAVTAPHNRIHITASYLFGSLCLQNNIKDVMVLNSDIWQSWNTPGAIWSDNVTASQYRFTFVGCRVYGYTSNVNPLVKLDDHRSSGHRFIGCVFDENPATGAIIVDDSFGLLIEGCFFGSGDNPSELAVWHLGYGVDVKNSEGVVVSNSQFNLVAADTAGVVFRESVVSGVIQNCMSRGQSVEGAFVVDVTDGDTGPIDIIGNVAEDNDNAIVTTKTSGTSVVNGLTVRGNRVRDVNAVTTAGAAIVIVDAPDVVVAENRCDDGRIDIEDSDRPQLVGNIVNAPAAAAAAIELKGTIDEAWIHGCGFPIGGAAYGVQIGASVSNTEVRTLSNNWRGAATADLNDNGTGTLT